MNYLAHLYLARHNDQAMIGGLLGDFVKGKSLSAYPGGVQQGIILHRAIDKYTDNHTVVKSCRELISSNRRRFAGILLDLFFDYYLARHWIRYSDRSLDEFSAYVYGLLANFQGPYPPRFREVVYYMEKEHWLGAYGTQKGIERAVNGIARRMSKFKKASRLTGAIDELQKNEKTFEKRFFIFFPDLIRFAEKRMHTLQSAEQSITSNEPDKTSTTP